MKPKMKKLSPEKFDKLDIVFGTNGPHVSELTPEEWFKILNHAIRISERLLKNSPKFRVIREVKKDDLLKIIGEDPGFGLRTLKYLRDLLQCKVDCKFSELQDVLAVESEIIGIDGAIRRDIKIIKNQQIEG